MNAEQDNLLWQIGQPDSDYRELALAGRYTEFLQRFPYGVRFHVGQSDARRDWSYIHPGPADTWAGSRTHPFLILFQMDEVPAGVCRFTANLVNTHYGAAPVLEVRVNGRYSCRFRLPTGGDDASLADPRAGRAHTLSFLFSSKHLQRGENSLILTVVEGSWLLYDAVMLEAGLQLPETPSVQNLAGQSPPLFRRIGGRLRQAVRVRLNNVGLEGEVEAGIANVADSVQKVSLIPGDNTFHLFMPPLKQTQTLRVFVRTGDRQWQTEFEGQPERRWKIFVAPSTHTDIGYTDWQERVFQRHNENTQIACQACETHPNFRWNLEVAYQAALFRQEHPPRFWRTLVPRIREGRIGLQGLYLNMLTGLCSGEEMVRVVTRAQVLARSCNLGKVLAANLTDVPTAVGTLPMFLRQAGVSYFAEAVNQYHAPLFAHADPRLVQAPFWWEGLDGSRVLAILTDSYGYVRRLNLTGSLEEAEAQVISYLRGFASRDYPGDAVYAYGGFFDNEPLDPRYADTIARWNEQWAYPQIVLSTVEEFFRYVEENYGGSLPVFRGDFGVYWEDGAGSTAHETALVRWAKRRIETAEGWLALVKAHQRGRLFPSGEVHRAWEEVLFFDEHTWGAWCSVSDPESEQTRHQWAFKQAYALRAAQRAEELERRAEKARSLLPRTKRDLASGGAQAVVAWNEFSWKRDVPCAATPPDATERWRIKDATTGRVLPVQRQGSRLYFLAEQVPPMGYASFVLEPLEPPRTAPLLKQTGDPWTWEGAGYRLQIDHGTGSIVSLKDVKRNREWVDRSAGYGLNQFLYVLGGEGTRLMYPHLAEPRYEVYSHTRASVELLENGAVRAVLVVRRAGAKVAPLDTFIVLWRTGRLEFLNVLHKQETLAREAGYFAFPFRFADQKAIRGFVELPYGVLQVENEQIPGGCREWYTTHSFAALSDGHSTVLLATPHNPLLTFGDFFKGLWRGKLGNLNGSVFAYVFNNYWDTNYKASQGGDMVFGFALQLSEAAFNPAAATRFGWETLAGMCDPRRPNLSPLEELHPARHLLDPPSQSLLQVHCPGDAVVVGGLTWEDDRLYIRLYNTATRRMHARVQFGRWTPHEAWRTDLVGRPQAKLATHASGVSVEVPARSIITLALR